MKKYKLAVIIIIPLILLLGLALTIYGVMKNETIAYAGMMVLLFVDPIVMFVLIVIGLVMVMTGKMQSKDEAGDDNPSESEKDREQRKRREINSTYNVENRKKISDYHMRHIANNYEYMKKHEKPKTNFLVWLFFGFLMTDFLLILIFAFLTLWIGVIVCFSLFVGTIMVAGIIKKILENRSMKVKIYTKSKMREILDGEVKASLFSSSVEAGSGSGVHSLGTSRIKQVVYTIKITANGKDYTAYSKTFYNVGDKVKIVLIGGKRAKIVTDEEIKKAKNLLK